MRRNRDGETGALKGLLDGVPTAVKDGLSMTGVPIYRGSLANGSNDALATVDRGGQARYQAPTLLGRCATQHRFAARSGTRPAMAACHIIHQPARPFVPGPWRETCMTSPCC